MIDLKNKKNIYFAGITLIIIFFMWLMSGSFIFPEISTLGWLGYEYVGIIVLATMLAFVLLCSIFIVFILTSTSKVIISLKNYAFTKETIQLRNIFPRKISSIAVILVMPVFFIWLSFCQLPQGKGRSAVIKSHVANMRPQAELYFDANGNYGVQKSTSHETCFAKRTLFDPEKKESVAPMLRGAEQVSLLKDTSVCAIGENGQSWAVNILWRGGEKENVCAAPFLKIKDFLVTPKKSSWCVDSSGKSRTGSEIETYPDGSVGCAMVLPLKTN